MARKPILGPNFNMASAVEANRHKKALGNARVTIGGDRLDENDNVIQTAGERAYQTHATPVERTVESIADVLPERKAPDQVAEQLDKDLKTATKVPGEAEGLVEDDQGNFIPAAEAKKTKKTAKKDSE